MIKAIQQFQLRTVIGTEKEARKTLALMKEAGYTGIELCGYMIKKMPLTIRILTRLAGMPMGKSGNLNWHQLVQESGLTVVSIHEDLGSILKRTDEIIEEARSFGTNYVVVTGMHQFDYSDRSAVTELAQKLNRAGKLLLEGGITFLYHNHNCEFQKVGEGQNAFDLLLELTDPAYVNFEFDSYWTAEAGADVLSWMKKLGTRMKLYHINDRGSRPKGKGSSILKSDSMELGTGNMNLTEMIHTARENGVEAVVLETHRNWIDRSPVRSFQVSAEFMNREVK